MEDLIDSMARRHLAYRRLDVCVKNSKLLFFYRISHLQVTIDRQRRRGNHIGKI